MGPNCNAAVAVVLMLANQGTTMQTMGTEGQLACLVDFLQSEAWLVLQVILPNSTVPSAAGSLLKRLSAAGISARVRRGLPEDTRYLSLGEATVPHLWFTPDRFTNDSIERAVFQQVRGDLRREWLLICFSERRRAHFLGGYAPQHRYMVAENDTVRLYHGWDYHRRQNVKPRTLCEEGGGPLIGEEQPSLSTFHNIMKGCVFRIVYPQDDNGVPLEPPVFLTVDNGRITGGLIGSVFLLLQEILGFTYTLRGIQHTNASAWDLGVQELHTNRSDLFVAGLMETARRRQLVNFTARFTEDSYGVVLPVSDDSSSNPFEERLAIWNVWCALLALLAIFALVLLIIFRSHVHHIDNRPVGQDTSVSFWVLVTFGIFCRQGAVVHYDSAVSYRLVVFSLYMFGLVTLTIFSAYLISSMTVHQYHLPFQSTDEALQKGWRLELFDSSATRQAQMTLFGRNADELPFTATGPPREGVIRVETMQFLKEENQKRASLGHRLGCMWPVRTIPFPISFAVRPNFPYRVQINRALLHILETGQIDHKEMRMGEAGSEMVFCRTDAAVESSEPDLHTVKLLFFVYGAGTGLAVLLLAMEVLASNIRASI